MTTQKWAGSASFLLAVSFIVAPLIYLIGNLDNLWGMIAYSLADFLYGPVISVSLIVVTYVLRELFGRSAFRRTNLALLMAVLAAAGMAAVAFMRASNRYYHLTHPELNLENSAIILTVWSTLVSAGNAFGFHFLGWVFVLLGSAGWTSQILPRPLSMLYLLAGVPSLLVYLFPELEGVVLILGVIIWVWQGILLLKPNAFQPPLAD